MPPKPLLRPFFGLFYNEKLRAQIDKLSCPPYDVISPKEEARLKKSSAYNFCNILLRGHGQSYDDLGKKFRQWLEEGILQQDERENFYLSEQKFKLFGKTYRRWGMLALLNLESQDKVFPHEKTHRRAKLDRTSLLEKVKANLSPVFIIYKNTATDIIKKLSQKYKKRKPFVSFKDRQDIEYRLWKISEKKEIAAVRNYFQNRKFLIADGHHRFEVARSFCRRKRKQKKNYYYLDYILAYLSPADENLLLLPIHRVVDLKIPLVEIEAKLRPYFLIKEKKTLKAAEQELKKAKAFSFILYQEGSFWFFSLKNSRTINKFLKRVQDKVYRKLDVYLLHEVVLHKILKRKILSEDEVVYVNNDSQAAARLAQEKNWSAFVLRPLKKTDIINIALGRKILPQKSTFFYPKFVSGLIMRKL